MSTHATPFPDEFYWGASTAAYQVEGGNENTDWARAARAGRVPPCGVAADHYRRFEEDFDLARALGHNAHRFSIEWARIEPEEGRFDEAQIAHYRAVLRALHARGITPFITLWHFTLPEWFAAKGGFEHSDAPELFARYVQFVVSALGDECTHFDTMNEPMVYASLGWLKGMWPPFVRLPALDRFKEVTVSGELERAAPTVTWRSVPRYLRVVQQLKRAHRRAYRAAKAVCPQAQVGLVKHTVVFTARGGVVNRIRAAVANYYWTHWFMRSVYRACDTIGLNYYHSVTYGDTSTYEKSDMGWDMRPADIYRALHLLARYQRPLYVTEAGLADADDSHRDWYIREQVSGVARALADGVDVRAHMYWSLLDNYEWAFGFTKRFGLVEVDFNTQARTVRPSAHAYRDIIQRAQG